MFVITPWPIHTFKYIQVDQLPTCKHSHIISLITSYHSCTGHPSKLQTLQPVDPPNGLTAILFSVRGFGRTGISHWRVFMPVNHRNVSKLSMLVLKLTNFGETFWSYSV